ncbi:MAG: NAD-dependent protein deacylase [Alphaproteobacteria bacterium]|nr:NAD-dependent protein deacylase [Alphaproteobacteria bacterium]|tara:strand:- start:1321 stop:2064 length:744 start_codon:yes stop_codon:yes gene_type:complete
MSVLESIAPGDGIVILTGAGISKESGLQTFRDPDGIWAKHRIEDVATPQAFATNPEAVLGFYNVRRSQMGDADIKPNAAHHALGRLQGFWPGGVLVVTQNIDDLHERGGSTRLIHMHGELSKTRCNACGGIVEGLGDLDPEMTCQACAAVGTLRPHVVWFGEMPLEMDRIGDALAACGLFVSIGTSGNVYPAAGFVQEARAHGARTIELNLEESLGASAFHEARYGPATEIVTGFVDELEALARAGA